jgi:hypothetical protein
LSLPAFAVVRRGHVGAPAAGSGASVCNGASGRKHSRYNPMIRCPRCLFETYLDSQGHFPMPDEHSPCIYLREQMAAGEIKDWMCPHLKEEVERVLRRRRS